MAARRAVAAQGEEVRKVGLAALVEHLVAVGHLAAVEHLAAQAECLAVAAALECRVEV